MAIKTVIDSKRGCVWRKPGGVTPVRVVREGEFPEMAEAEKGGAK